MGHINTGRNTFQEKLKICNNNMKRKHISLGVLKAYFNSILSAFFKFTQLYFNNHSIGSFLFVYVFYFFKYSYETANGIKGQETGTLKKASTAETKDVVISKGSVSYTAPDGTLISLTYEADDVNGFQPKVKRNN